MIKIFIIFTFLFNISLVYGQTPKVFTIQDDANGLTLPGGADARWVKVGLIWVNRNNGDIAATPDVSKEYIQQYIQSVNSQRIEENKQEQARKELLSRFTNSYCVEAFNNKILRPQFFERVGKDFSVNPDSVSLNRVSISKNAYEATCIAIFYTPKGPKECHLSSLGVNWKFNCY